MNVTILYIFLFRIFIAESADTEPFKFLVLFFNDVKPEDSATYDCSVTYTTAESGAVQTSTASVDMHVAACDPGYFICETTQTSSVPSPGQRFSMSMVAGPSPVDYPGADLQCISETLRCDGHFDCESRSDERNCRTLL